MGVVGDQRGERKAGLASSNGQIMGGHRLLQGQRIVGYATIVKGVFQSLGHSWPSIIALKKIMSIYTRAGYLFGLVCLLFYTLLATSGVPF